MKTSKNNCDPCEADFKKEVKELVDEAKAPTKKEHEAKEKEVDQAFDKKAKAKK